MYTNKIIKRIRGKQRGWVFTAKNFVDIAPRNTVDQILFRLVKQGTIRKISRGIYDFPVIHDKLGMLTPNADTLAKTMITKTNDTICSNGAMAANQLGLDTQVPAKAIYFTSGQSKRKRILNYTIQFKHSKIISQLDSNSNLCRLILALQHLGKNHIDNAVIQKCRRHLSKKDKKDLVKIISKLPDWMAPFILEIAGIEYGNISKIK